MLVFRVLTLRRNEAIFVQQSGSKTDLKSGLKGASDHSLLPPRSVRDVIKRQPRPDQRGSIGNR